MLERSWLLCGVMMCAALLPSGVRAHGGTHGVDPAVAAGGYMSPAGRQSDGAEEAAELLARLERQRAEAAKRAAPRAELDALDAEIARARLGREIAELRLERDRYRSAGRSQDAARAEARVHACKEKLRRLPAPPSQQRGFGPRR